MASSTPGGLPPLLSEAARQELLGETVSCGLDIEIAFRALRRAGHRMNQIEERLRWGPEADADAENVS